VAEEMVEVNLRRVNLVLKPFCKLSLLESGTYVVASKCIVCVAGNGLGYSVDAFGVS
jgi:hypothetical protein